MAKIIRIEYPIIARWQKNMVRLHANQPANQSNYCYTCSIYIALLVLDSKYTQSLPWCSTSVRPQCLLMKVS